MIVGIDLGTTNSLIAVYGPGGPSLFANAGGNHLTPSVVSIDDEGGVLVGAGARDRLVTHPDRSVAAFKRWMGSPRETNLGGRSLRAEQLSALVLRSLIADAEAASGTKIEEAVISVPAYFSDAQRSATRVAGELAGIKVERLINEPTAAALAYGLQEREGGGRFLVFDLGGGTLDVSIIEIFEGVVEVHASAGDNYLGGEDFLQVLVGAAAKDLGFDPAALAVAERAQLLRRLEALKLALTSQREVATDLLINGETRRFAIDEPRFASLAEPLVLRLRQPLERALRDANIHPDSLSDVVLVGGASRMPLVSRAVSRLTGRLPLRHVDPDRAIALGAATAAGMKARDTKLDEIILTDVCPYTLGTDIAKRDQSGATHHGLLLLWRADDRPSDSVSTAWDLCAERRHDARFARPPARRRRASFGSLFRRARKQSPLKPRQYERTIH